MAIQNGCSMETGYIGSFMTLVLFVGVAVYAITFSRFGQQSMPIIIDD